MAYGRPVAMLRRMVEIDSVTGSEANLAGYLVAEMGELGFRSRVDEAGNAVGAIGAADGPLIMLLGHLDTVPGRLPVRVRNGMLHGRGTVDAKGPLAAMIWAAARVAGECDARLLVVGAVGEEGLSPGARHLLRGPAPDAVFIGEPSGIRNVVIGYKGIMRITIEIRRPRAHTSSPAEKAVEAAVGLWHDVREHLTGLHQGKRLFDQAIPCLEELAGDIIQARAQISCRVPPGFDAPAFGAWLDERAGEDVITVTEDLPAARSSRTDPVVRALCGALRRRGDSPTLKVKLGTSDMNVISPSWRVPTAAYGPGDARFDHTDDERIPIADYLFAIDVLTDAIAEVAVALGSGGLDPGARLAAQRA
jgi:[amino group carrier protein]-lysine/ornithine hydrolase